MQHVTTHHNIHPCLTHHNTPPCLTHHNIHPCLTSPEPRPLGQDALELLRGAARDQRPDQRQGVRVEVRLRREWLKIELYRYIYVSMS